MVDHDPNVDPKYTDQKLMNIAESGNDGLEAAVTDFVDNVVNPDTANKKPDDQELIEKDTDSKIEATDAAAAGDPVLMVDSANLFRGSKGFPIRKDGQQRRKQ